MPAAPRPRRSTASASFAHLFQPIALDGDESSTDDGNSNVSKDGEEKKKKKRKTVYVPEEDSGSEFEVGEAGGKGADSDNEETSSEGSLEAASDDDDLGSGAGDSDVSGSVVGNSPPRKGKGKGGRKSGPSASAIVGNSKKGRAPVVASSSIITKGKNSDRPTTKDGPTRARIPASHPSSGISHMYEYFGPLAARGASRSLDLTSPDAGDDTVSAKASKRRRCLSEGRPTAGMNLLEDSIVDAMMDEATVNPFGVEAKSVRDASWHPGQWDILAGKERSRWGGWYPEVTVPRDTLETLSDDQADVYLPSQAYPLRPHAIHRPIGADEDVDGTQEPSDMADDDNLELPQLPPDFQESSSHTGQPVAGPSGSRERSAGLVSGAGSVRVQLGRLETAKVQQEGTEIELPRFQAVRLDEYVPRKPGHLFNAGGAVGKVKWAPRADGSAEKEYLAVTTISDPDAPLRHTPANDTQGSSLRSMIQIWSVPAAPSARELHYETLGANAGQESGAMKLEIGLCVDEDVRAVEWCPRGGSADSDGAADSTATTEAEDEPVPTTTSRKLKGKARAKAAQSLNVGSDDAMNVDSETPNGVSTLGILAVVHGNGTIAIYAVPHPDQLDGEDKPTFVRAQARCKFAIPDASVVSVAWGGHEMLAGGCTNGAIAVWHVASAIRAEKQTGMSRPLHLYQAHSGVIRSLVFVDTPPPDLADRSEHDFDERPTGIAAVGYDGTVTLSDLRQPDGGTISLYQQRGPIYDIAFGAHAGVVYVHDADDRVKAFYLKPSALGSEGRVAIHTGPVLSVTASPHHGLVVSTSADGSAVLTSGVRALRKRRVRGHFSHKVFRLDFKRETGELRMWDNLETEHRAALDPANPARTAKKDAAAEAAVPGETPTAAWAAEQGVLCSAWHPSIDRCALLATGTACGLARIDWLEGTAQALA
ncbi:hypothetical protein BMF94_2371 [Rhodotorula taiwanensis]|uniref:Uncharacterized protein n=1 Tax=Rhodotorula taiwanensis TaxID=741276 RepID=A0A2S5BCW3_9BASI|nr:hypothetical protein BMF94_2371 [Rhodotorula taiwanensis]